MDKFQKLLDENGIKNFKAKEVFFLGASNATLKLNAEPPPSMWGKIIPTLKVADAARNEYGEPIRILSAYRNAAYNKAIGGASQSQHRLFTALDLGCKTPTKLHKILKRMRDEGKFKGGLGIYKTFVHVDTRGENADWKG